MAMDANIGFLRKHKKFAVGGKVPYITGTITPGGVEYDIAIWVPKPGKDCFFAKITPKEEGEENCSSETKSAEPEKKATPKPAPEPKKIKPTSLFK